MCQLLLQRRLSHFNSQVRIVSRPTYFANVVLLSKTASFAATDSVLPWMQFFPLDRLFGTVVVATSHRAYLSIYMYIYEAIGKLSQRSFESRA